MVADKGTRGGRITGDFGCVAQINESWMDFEI